MLPLMIQTLQFSLFTPSNLYSAISFILAFVPLLIMLYALARGFEGSALCMDCQQCVAVCPTRKSQKEEYLGPRGIEIACRAGNIRMATEGKIFSCTSCMSCVAACPRGLNVKHDMDRMRGDLAKQGLGQMDAHKHIINMATKYGNVYEEKPRWKPEINTQKEQLTKFMKNYAKISQLDDFELT
jgi:heterodisulfide reductase subunit C